MGSRLKQVDLEPLGNKIDQKIEELQDKHDRSKDPDHRRKIKFHQAALKVQKAVIRKLCDDPYDPWWVPQAKKKIGMLSKRAPRKAGRRKK